MGRAALTALVLASCSYRPPPSLDDDLGDGGPPPPDDTAPPVDGAPPFDTAPPVDAPVTRATTDHVAAADVYLNSLAPNSSMAGDAFVIVDDDPDGVGLFLFDLAALAGSQVTAALLHIFTSFDPGDTVQISVMLESWSESQATFNQRANGTPWSSPGATPPSSRSSVVIGTFTPNQANTEFVVPLTTSAVADWVANPGTNFGLAIHTVNTNGPRFVSREGPIDQRPFLRVTHTP